MTKKQVIQFIEIDHPVTYAPSVTKVVCNNTIYYGFFESFDDYRELKEKNQWRFIPINQAIEYREEAAKTQLANPKYSIILEGDEMISIIQERKSINSSRYK